MKVLSILSVLTLLAGSSMAMQVKPPCTTKTSSVDPTSVVDYEPKVIVEPETNYPPETYVDPYVPVQQPEVVDPYVPKEDYEPKDYEHPVIVEPETNYPPETYVDPYVPVQQPEVVVDPIDPYVPVQQPEVVDPYVSKEMPVEHYEHKSTTTCTKSNPKPTTYVETPVPLYGKTVDVLGSDASSNIVNALSMIAGVFLLSLF